MFQNLWKNILIPKGEFIIADFASYIIPALVCIIIFYGCIKKVNVYSAFTEGVVAGTRSVANIFPALFGLFVAVSVFRASGLVDRLSKILHPICTALHFPSELLPFALLRPISGSGSLAMASDIFSTYGPDSFAGRYTSVMMGSTETTFYTVAIYFGATGTKNTRHTLKCALLADLFSMILSTVICSQYF